MKTAWGSSVREKCLITDSGDKLRFVAFDDFHGENTPTVKNVKVLRWGNGTWSWEEIYAFGSPSSASQRQQWKYKTAPRIRCRNKIEFCLLIKHFVPKFSKREGNRCYLLKWDFNSSGKIIRDNKKLDYTTISLDIFLPKIIISGDLTVKDCILKEQTNCKKDCKLYQQYGFEKNSNICFLKGRHGQGKIFPFFYSNGEPLGHPVGAPRRTRHGQPRLPQSSARPPH